MEEYYVYVLKSKRTGGIYIGQTSNLDKRLKQHNAGKVLSTRSKRPFEVCYAEVFSSRADAVIREKYLKSGCGREFIKKQVIMY